MTVPVSTVSSVYVSKVNTVTIDDVIETENNDSNDAPTDKSASTERNEKPETDWTISCIDEGSNFVNFKKNAIKKDKDVTPIEISIRNAQKGSLHALLIKHFNNNSFLWSNASGKTIRINPFTQKVKDAMIVWLKDRKYQFHTFLDKESKPNAFIIRGLPNSVHRSHIESALQQAGILFNGLERHSTGYTRSHEIQSDLWRITTPNSVTIQHFKAIDGILNVKIRVEILRRSPVLQCKNCQLFFHSAAGCHRKFRCVKCDQDHQPSNCPRNTNQSLPVVCCNCHKNHSANDLKHCEFFVKHIKPVIDKRAKERSKTADIKTTHDGKHNPDNESSMNKQSLRTQTDSYSSIVKKSATTKAKSSVPPTSTSNSNQPQHKASNISKSDLKALLLQNLNLMTAQQELFQKLSCLVE